MGERAGDDGRAFLRAVAVDEGERPELRERAVRVLAEAGATGAELARLYDAIPSQPVRMRLVTLLAERADREALEKLRAIATSDPDAEVRRRALRRLAERG
jgi:ATP phosphoribosyltransferase regulatory subunit HisZ